MTKRNNGRFVKGNKEGGRTPGAVSQKTKMWNELGEYIVNEGARKYMEYLKTLDPQNYMTRFEAVLEYFKPKLSRTDVTSGDKPIKNDIKVTFVNGS